MGTWPLEPLVPACVACGTEVAVCFKELQICEARCAAYCTICAAVAGEQVMIAMRQEQALPAQRALRSQRQQQPRSVPACRCSVCGVGELRARSQQPLAY